MTDPSHSRFRLPHWGWLLLATVVLAAGYVGLSVWLPYHREQPLIRTIAGWGGRVEIETGGPEWLRHLVGEDRLQESKIFDRIVTVELLGLATTDAQIRQLSGLTGLKHLDLDDTAVTDSGLAELSGLTSLEELCLNRTAVTDAGLKNLNRYTNLYGLKLADTHVTDKGLAHLSRCTRLCGLRLRNTLVTDNGLAHLSQLPDLYDLDLGRTAVSDSGLVHFRGTNLRRLDLSGTSVSSDAIEELKAALPRCHIIH